MFFSVSSCLPAGSWYYSACLVQAMRILLSGYGTTGDTDIAIFQQYVT